MTPLHPKALEAAKAREVLCVKEGCPRADCSGLFCLDALTAYLQEAGDGWCFEIDDAPLPRHFIGCLDVGSGRFSAECECDDDGVPWLAGTRGTYHGEPIGRHELIAFQPLPTPPGEKGT